MTEYIENKMNDIDNDIELLLNNIKSEIKKLRADGTISARLLAFSIYHYELLQIQNSITSFIDRHSGLKNQSEKFYKNHFLTFGFDDSLE
jgi:hypothetical protein